jgi:hypothetical protein
MIGEDVIEGAWALHQRNMKHGDIIGEVRQQRGFRV